MSVIPFKFDSVKQTCMWSLLSLTVWNRHVCDPFWIWQCETDMYIISLTMWNHFWCCETDTWSVLILCNIYYITDIFLLTLWSKCETQTWSCLTQWNRCEKIWDPFCHCGTQYVIFWHWNRHGSILTLWSSQEILLTLWNRRFLLTLSNSQEIPFDTLKQ